jgi:hypothetical protein
MDAQAIGIADGQEASIKSRKQLSESTKGKKNEQDQGALHTYTLFCFCFFLHSEFRQSSPKEVIDGVKTLLKRYQVWKQPSIKSIKSTPFLDFIHFVIYIANE